MVYSVTTRTWRRSLGTFMVLDHVLRARKLGLPYVYLGYWVEGSPKMDYKSRFLPQERLMPQGWERVEHDARAPEHPRTHPDASIPYEDREAER